MAHRSSCQPFSPIATDRPSLNSFRDEPAKGLEVLRSFQAGVIFIPHMAMFSRAYLWRLQTPSHTAGVLSPPMPCPWFLDRRRHSLSRLVGFRSPCLAWTVTPGAGGHKQVRTKFATINHRNTGAVNVQCRDAHIVSSQSTRPGLVPAPTTPDPTQDSSTRRRKRNTHLANPLWPPHRLATPFFHIPPPPLRHPSRPTTLARSQPWRNLTQSSSMFTPLSLPITKSHDSVHFLRARLRQPHFLRMATPLPMETSLANPARHQVGRTL